MAVEPEPTLALITDIAWQRDDYIERADIAANAGYEGLAQYLATCATVLHHTAILLDHAVNIYPRDNEP